MTHSVTAAHAQLTQPERKEWNHNGSSHWLLSKRYEHSLPPTAVVSGGFEATRFFWFLLCLSVCLHSARLSASFLGWTVQMSVLYRNHNPAVFFFFLSILLNVHFCVTGIRVSHDARRFKERSRRCRLLGPPAGGIPPKERQRRSEQPVKRAALCHWLVRTFRTPRQANQNTFSRSLRQQRSYEYIMNSNLSD